MTGVSGAVPAAPPAVSIKGLNKTFLSRRGHPVEALRNVTMDVAAGEVVAVLGPSGCGKSSLLRVLAGLDAHYGGSVNLHLSGEETVERSRLPSATVFQSDSTLPWLTVLQNITRIGLSSLRLTKAQKHERAMDVLELVGLADFTHAYPHELSGGMRQRVSIARALATQPHLLLMDEPLAALDAQTRLVMQQELLAIWGQTRSTVIYITHDIEEAVSLADRIVVLSSRPGTVIKVSRSIERTSNDVTHMRTDPRFGELVTELWQAVAGSVGTSLSTSSREDT